MHVARHRVERIEDDDVADLGAEFADLVDQADGADHPRQRDRDDAEEDACLRHWICCRLHASPYSRLLAAEASSPATDYRRCVVHN